MGGHPEHCGAASRCRVSSPNRPIEAFTVSVLPGAARFDVSRPGADGGNPVPDGLGDKFRPNSGPLSAIVRTYETGRAAKDEKDEQPLRTSMTSVEFSFRSTTPSARQMQYGTPTVTIPFPMLNLKYKRPWLLS